MSSSWKSRLTVVAVAALLVACQGGEAPVSERWSEQELRILRSLSLLALDDPPPANSNRVADDPRAAALGEQLFFDPRLSGNGQISCASCHEPARFFTDGKAKGIGMGATPRNTPGIIGGAWQTWFYWDGRRDSLWSQALIPIEAPPEMGGSRMAAVRLLGTDPDYRRDYEKLFGAFPQALLDRGLPEHAGPFAGDEARAAWQRLPFARRDSVNRVYANLGKAIAAFERTLHPRETPFDRYVAALLKHGDAEADQFMDEQAIAGAALFIDATRTQCLQCHNGPLLTNGSFHDVGSGRFSGPQLDYGRMFGVQSVMMDEFNCLGAYSDAEPDDCLALRFLSQDKHNPMAGAFKTPSLRNLVHTAPYFHDGRYANLAAVMEHYRKPPAGENAGHELNPLDLDESEVAALVAFMRALSEAPREAVAAETTLRWSDSERALLKTLTLAALPAAPPARGNAHADSKDAARLGAALFNDKGLSATGEIACASCHRPEFGMSDGRARAAGIAPLSRNAPGLLGVAWRRWLYWDGRKDSLWSQALEPIETAAEMGSDRTRAVRHVLGDEVLSALYRTAFGALPDLDLAALPERAGPRGDSQAQAAWLQLSGDQRAVINRAFSDLGKAIAAHERSFELLPTRFDAWVTASERGETQTAARQMNRDELAGLKLFISGATMCVSCHNGPHFTDDSFHNIGTAPASGRNAGQRFAAGDEFNCESRYSDDHPDTDCPHLVAIGAAEIPSLQEKALRTPGLRNLALTGPYMHDGRFASLDEVLDYYSSPPAHELGRHELSAAVDLDPVQREQLEAFLLTLSEPPR